LLLLIEIAASAIAREPVTTRTAVVMRDGDLL
jgi:hypothetical protein